MLLNFDELVSKYNIKFNGIIHVGAYDGKEYPIYLRYNVHRILYFEPVTANYEQLLATIERIGKNDIEVGCVHCALGNINDYIDINIANNGESSSLLTPKMHLSQYPNITFQKTERVQVAKLDNYWPADVSKYNFLNMDVQGYELEVLKGAINSLQYIDYIITEVNRAELYEDCVQIDELDKFLRYFGFEQKEICWTGGTWGDAFYKKVGV